MEQLLPVHQIRPGTLVLFRKYRYNVAMVADVSDPPGKIGVTLTPSPASRDIAVIIVICDRDTRFAALNMIQD